MSEGMITDTGVSAKGHELRGCRLGVAIGGGIGAVEVVKIIREFRRFGAEVWPVMSPRADRFVTPLSVEWAAARAPVRGLSAEAEHLEKLDAVVVVPLTLNGLAKMAHGFAEDAVSSLVATHIGRRLPLLLVPAMNSAMAAHPLYAEHLAKLVSWGAVVYPGSVEEGRLKVPAAQQLVAWATNEICQRRKDKKD